MARPLSKDLRERVAMAVVREGLSRNQAAARLGVAVSTANIWVRPLLKSYTPQECANDPVNSGYDGVIPALA